MVLDVKKVKRPDVRIYPDLDSLNHALASTIAEQVDSAVKDNGIFTILLSGGSTPRALYRILGAEYRDRIPWREVYLFWGDERYLPPEDPRSNYRMVQESLLSQIAIPFHNVQPMPTGFSDPQEAAHAYEDVLQAQFQMPWPCFDLALQGLGAEGHTASLFPNSPVLEEQERWVVPVTAPVDPPLRLTLTLPVLNHAAAVYFLAAGAEKAQALQQAVTGSSDLRSCPAAMVRPSKGDLIWWVDQAAASLLPASFRSQKSGS